MGKTFIVIVWHQAGGNNESKVYYTWQDENENTKVFNSYEEAETAWRESSTCRLHAAFIVDCSDQVFI